MNLGKLREMVRDREAWHALVYGVTVRHDLVTEQQQQFLFQIFFYHLDYYRVLGRIACAIQTAGSPLLISSKPSSGYMSVQTPKLSLLPLLPSGNHEFDLQVCEHTSVLQTSPSVSLF